MIPVPESVSESEEQSVLADWAERTCLIGTTSSISLIKLEDLLGQAQVDDAEAGAYNVLSEIERRHLLAPDTHPIRVVNKSLERVKEWNSALTYSFQLLLAMQS